MACPRKNSASLLSKAVRFLSITFSEYSLIFSSFFYLDLLKNKSQPEAAANDVGAWVVSEREMRERLKKEKEEREEKEKIEVRLLFFS